MNIVKSETGVTGAVSIGGLVTVLKLRANGGDATVTINRQQFNLYGADANWLELSIDVKNFTVDSGNIDYIGLG